MLDWKSRSDGSLISMSEVLHDWVRILIKAFMDQSGSIVGNILIQFLAKSVMRR